MTFLQEFNRQCRRLGREEDGVVLAFTVVVFLMLFVLASAVYGVGETVRQRVVIQNAADAAAYSGAVVEADTISRVACINRAMSWTYVQMGRMEMDYIVDKWLERVVFMWQIDYMKVRAFSGASTCSNGGYSGSNDWYAGQGYGQRKHVRLNKRTWVEVEKIKEERMKAAQDKKSWGALIQPIEEARQNIKDMNRAEEDLITQLPQRVYKVVKATLKQNIKDTYNDNIAGGADIMFSLIQADEPFKNWVKLRSDEEKLFLKYGGYMQGPKPAFQHRGVAEASSGNWWIRPGGGDGIYREYRQQSNRLIAEWYWFGGQWHLTGDPPVCVRMATLGRGYSVVRAIELKDNRFATERCIPWKLKEDYFARGGAIIVGLARRNINPFYFVFGSKGQEGLFKAFTLHDDSRFMWCAATSIAGWNPNWPGASQGEYDPTYWKSSIEDQNLRNTDWDATLIPLYRAWTRGKNLTWSGASGGAVLDEVRKRAWGALYGGGGAVGRQSPPPRIHGRGEPTWKALDGWIVH